MEVFPIIPASSKALWFIVAGCVVLALIISALAFTAYSARHSRVVVNADSIRIAGDFWGRTIPLSRLDLTAARVVDLETASELAPRRRTFGTGLPGYASGWFRLRGGEKALVYLTDRRRIAYVPTAEGYALLLSVEDPAGLIDTLRQRAPL